MLLSLSFVESTRSNFLFLAPPLSALVGGDDPRLDFLDVLDIGVREEDDIRRANATPQRNIGRGKIPPALTGGGAPPQVMS